MNLPEDILLEILSRLPVRSLIRFKCVSKTWNALVDSPRLVDMHLNLQRTKGDEHIHIIRCNLDCTPKVRVVTSFDDFESLSRLTVAPDVEVPGYQHSTGGYAYFSGDANGIVCISDNFSNITLWNPALREFRMLPPRSFYHPPDCVLFIGFGFDDATNDYKVVCVERFRKEVYPPPPTIEVVQVYNLKTNSWRRLETGTCESVTDYSMAPFNFPIFFEGKVHWSVWGLPCKQRFIHTFNMTTELFGEVHCPHLCEHYDPFHSSPRLFVLGKSTLSLVVVYKRTSNDLWYVDGQLDEGWPAPNVIEQVDESWQVDVWVLNDYNVKDSWTKQHYVISSISNLLDPLSFWKKDKLLLLTSDDDDDDVLICYDLQTGQQHHVRHYDNYSAVWSFDVVICVETLVSIK